MKRYNLYITFLLSIFLFMAACTDEENTKRSLVEEGVPVMATLKFVPEESAKLATRSLTDEQQKQVNDLYVLVFDKDYKRKGGKYFTKEDLGSSGSTASGTIQLETTSGECYIYGVANVKANQLEDLESALEEVATVEDLNQLTARLNSPAEDRSSANLMMCGVYVSEDANIDQKKEGYCVISTAGTPSKGQIVLRRLDSHITFKIELGKKISRFTPKSWQVFNMPYVSNVNEQSTEASKSEKDYFNSNKFVQFDKNSFNFYMLENLKESLLYEGQKAKYYSDRERQEKLGGSFDKEGQTCTNGAFLFADKFATYVEIKGALEIEEDNGAVTTADVTYTVHLGYVDEAADDFKSKRNTKYTYTVTILGVNDIIMEVVKEEEIAPGVEGEVIEASKTIFNLDAHYHTFLIALEKEKVGNSLNYQVVTPFATVSSSDISTIKDIDWVKFKRNAYSQGKYNKNLEKYPLTRDQESQLIKVDKLSEDIQDATAEKGMVYYTVFVNEYYYETPPTGADWQKPYWKNFINQPDRKMMLIYEPRYSPDGESSYATAEYLIKQQSIQSYYSTTNFNDSKTAIGIEHYNENGELEWGNATKGSSVSNGKDNMWKQLGNGKSWFNYLSTTYSAEKVNNYDLTSTYKKAYIACLQRNRDENGDGKISEDELKWYLPARDQLVNVYIGAESLQDPIYDHTKFTDATQKHFLTSSLSGNNIWKIWAEEGASTGMESKSAKLDFRCVRNLGMDDDTDDTDVSDPCYSYSNYEFTLTGMDELSLRSNYISKAEIAPHHNFDRNNLPYKKFRVARDVVRNSNGIKYVSGTSGWWTMNGIDKAGADRGNSFCSSYQESGYPAGTWRVPNQRELLLMYMENLHKDVDVKNWALYSRTAWKFDSKRHFGTHNYNNANVSYLSQESPFVDTAVRCVQDIK